jgi:hypothetical protein
MQVGPCELYSPIVTQQGNRFASDIFYSCLWTTTNEVV